MNNPSLRVLVVESQGLIAVEIEDILTEKLGCSVTITAHAEFGDALANGRYDVVLVDAAPSKAENLARAEQIEASGAATVFLSAYEDFSPNARSSHGFPIIDKPFDPFHLVETVKAAAAHRYDSAQDAQG